MSQGFHPKAKMSFPLALAVGIEGQEEVMEVELDSELAAEEVRSRLESQLPDGLCVTQVEPLADGVRKAQVVRVTYEVPIPSVQLDQVQSALTRLRTQESYWIRRDDRADPLDLWADLESIELRADTLVFVQRVTRTAAVQPKEVLAALDVDDVELTLSKMRRSRVELQVDPTVIPQSPISTVAKDNEGRTA
jgi:radical SAM-linked protein